MLFEHAAEATDFPVATAVMEETLTASKMRRHDHLDKSIDSADDDRVNIASIVRSPISICV